MSEKEIQQAIENALSNIEKKMIDNAKKEASAHICESLEGITDFIKLTINESVSGLKKDISNLYTDNRTKILLHDKAIADHEERIELLEDKDKLYNWIARHGLKVIIGLLIAMLIVLYNYLKTL